jgi:hypothetical protein
MDQMSTLKPSDFGYPDTDWTSRSLAVTSKKITDLNSQSAVTPRDIAIRNRRIQEHTNNLSGIRFALRLMERYTGLINQSLSVNPGNSSVLQALQPLPAFRFYCEFFDFDSDCQCGTVWGTIGPN